MAKYRQVPRRKKAVMDAETAANANMNRKGIARTNTRATVAMATEPPRNRRLRRIEAALERRNRKGEHD